MFAGSCLGTCTMEVDDTGNWCFTVLCYSEECPVTDVGKFIQVWGSSAMFSVHVEKDEFDIFV